MQLFNRYQREIQIITVFKENWREYCILKQKYRNSSEDDQKISALREILNTTSGEAEYCVRKSGVPTGVYYSPPPAVGGLAGQIDFFANLFQLNQFSISPQMIVDCLEKAIGNYQFKQKQFRRKLLNPFYWIGEIIRIPFYIASFAGFNSHKFEFSFIGKSYKFIAGLIAFAWTIIEMLNFFGINLAKLIR